MEIVIGIGEYAISRNMNDVIKTYALGSCIAVTVYDHINKTAGMAHIALPKPNIPYNDGLPPCYYASRAVPLLIDSICTKTGCPKVELEIGLFGGAESVVLNDVFKIGKKNIIAVKEAINDLKLRYKKAEVGGTYSRTIEINAATGIIMVIKQPMII